MIVKFDKIREDKRGVSNSLGILIKKIKNYNYIQSNEDENRTRKREIKKEKSYYRRKIHCSPLRN